MNSAAVQQKLAAMLAANDDKVSIPKIYIDMTNDIEAAAVLDELMFWTLPKKNGKTSLRVFKNGALWLAVRRKDWWDRKRLTERQADSAIAKLVKLDMVEKDVFLFDGKPTVHIRMKMDVFGKVYGEKMSELAAEDGDENLIRDIADLYQMMGFPNETVNSNLPNGEMLNLPNGEIINSLQQPPNTSSRPARKPKFKDPLWDIQHGELPDEEGIKVARRIEIYTDVANRLSAGLRRGEFPQTTEAQKVYRWIAERETAGQSLDGWIQWAMEGKRAEFSFVYHKDPALIKRDWLQVYPNTEGKTYAEPEPDGGYRF